MVITPTITCPRIRLFKHALSQKRYVYWWADGVYFNVRLDEERTCVLVLIGATEDGTKELIAVVDGYRESTQSWRELLQQLKRPGLSTAPELAIGNGSLGFWIALQEEYGQVSQQRCWVPALGTSESKTAPGAQALDQAGRFFECPRYRPRGVPYLAFITQLSADTYDFRDGWHGN